MEFAEGKGPRTVTRTWTTGPFVTNYGQGVTPVTNPPAVPFPAAGSNGVIPTGTTVGTLAPGLMLFSGTSYPTGAGNPLNTDVGFICSLESSTSLQDSQSITVILNAETGFTGSGIVNLQGTATRFSNQTVYSGTNWVTITGATVSAPNVPVVFDLLSTKEIVYNAYRLVASGFATTSGIIDWSITSMFLDLSAMQVGNNATQFQSSIGQNNIANPAVLSLSGGVITSTPGPSPYANSRAGADWIQ